MELRRPSKKKKTYSLSPSYPDGPPATELEKCIARLDQESYKAALFAKVDDILTFSLFRSKSRPKSYRVMTLTRAFLEEDPPVSVDTAYQICALYNQQRRQSSDTWEIATKSAAQIVIAFPNLFPETCCRQVIRHLLARYHGLKEHEESLVQIEKVQFHGSGNSKVTGGLKAKQRIGAGTVIPTTSSSMSLDIVERESVSTIQSSPNQLGQQGPRIILGPFRFANHDCSPNCQIMANENSHAYSICAIKDIEPGESITVNYSKDFSYFKKIICSCATCQPTDPPTAHRKPINYSLFVKDPQRKTTRRAGTKQQRRKAKREGNYSGSGSTMEEGQ